MHLTDSISILPKTHSTTTKRLQSVGIQTIGDLIQYYPSRYVDYSNFTTLDKVQPGDTATIRGTITAAKNAYARRITIQTVMIDDGTGTLKLTWFNQPYIVRMCAVGLTLAVAGEIEKKGTQITMKPDEYEIIKDTGPGTHTGSIVPIYPQKKGLTTRLLRDKIAAVLPSIDPREITEWLPPDVVRAEQLMSYAETVMTMHRPKDMEAATKARTRVGFDELLLIHLSNALVKKQWDAQKVTKPLHLTPQIQTSIEKFVSQLPFTLTSSQQHAWKQISEDLQKARPMNRFLQGDVGSGKTIVAILASLLSTLNGADVLCMCPTEVLANQHFVSFTKLLAGIPNLKIELVTSTSNKKSSKSKAASISSKIPLVMVSQSALSLVEGNYDTSRLTTTNSPAIYIGTHALLTDAREFKNIGLVIIDEQHRFGVSQRAKIKERGAHSHLLTMTATPIPRTIALTLFGDLDISTLTDKPVGRLTVKTYAAPEEKRESAYRWIEKQITETKCQAFVICPRIDEEEQEEGKETIVSMRAAVAEAARLQKDVFPKLRIAVVHGKLKAAEKEQIMSDFKNHLYDILVSTTVIEVGIDIPNASIILIEGAERFGLAQLHQLRGRVGRGNKQSHCVLFTSEYVATPERLNFFAKTQNGQELAEFDFRERGPGDIYGTAQSGTSSLRIANLFDYALVSHTKELAEKLLERGLTAEIKSRLATIQFGSIAKD
ncbi:MAG: ATP-dependent DNA helicase RecG [bacterium]